MHSFPVWKNSLSIKYREFTICFANSLWFFYPFREYITNSLSFPRIHYLFGEFTMNLLGVLEFTMNFREITMNSLIFSQIYYEFSVRSANLLSFLRLNYDFTFCFTNSLSFLRKCNEFTFFSAITLWIHCPYRESSENSRDVLRILFEFNWFPRINFEFTFYSANWV